MKINTNKNLSMHSLAGIFFFQNHKSSVIKRNHAQAHKYIWQSFPNELSKNNQQKDMSPIFPCLISYISDQKKLST